jgi:hypothetical protein
LLGFLLFSISNVPALVSPHNSRLSSLEEDTKEEKSKANADHERREKYGTNRKKKSKFSKPEIMEELIRE